MDASARVHKYVGGNEEGDDVNDIPMTDQQCKEGVCSEVGETSNDNLMRCEQDQATDLSMDQFW